MTGKNKQQLETAGSTLQEQLAEITETMQRDKVELTPDVKKYFDENMEKFMDQMAKGQMPVKKELDEFIDNLKSTFERLGEVIIFAKRRTMSGDPAYYGMGVSPQMEDVGNE